MTVILYGLKNCDTTRKARQWLAVQGIEHRFCDLREDGLSAERLDAWLQTLGWEELLNRNSRTWRELDKAEKAGLDERTARELMLTHPALIKRPVLESGLGNLVGFSPARYETLLAGAD